MRNKTTSSSIRNVLDGDRVTPVDLQQVETELEAVVTTQQQETRDVCCLKEAIVSISDDLNVIKACPPAYTSAIASAGGRTCTSSHFAL